MCICTMPEINVLRALPGEKLSIESLDVDMEDGHPDVMNECIYIHRYRITGYEIYVYKGRHKRTTGNVRIRDLEWDGLMANPHDACRRGILIVAVRNGVPVDIPIEQKEFAPLLRSDDVTAFAAVRKTRRAAITDTLDV